MAAVESELSKQCSQYLLYILVVHTDANTVQVIYATVSEEYKLGPSWNMSAICSVAKFLLVISKLLACVIQIFWQQKIQTQFHEK